MTPGHFRLFPVVAHPLQHTFSTRRRSSNSDVECQVIPQSSDSGQALNFGLRRVINREGRALSILLLNSLESRCRNVLKPIPWPGDQLRIRKTRVCALPYIAIPRRRTNAWNTDLDLVGGRGRIALRSGLQRQAVTLVSGGKSSASGANYGCRHDEVRRIRTDRRACRSYRRCVSHEVSRKPLPQPDDQRPG